MNWIKFGHARAHRGAWLPRDHAGPSRARAKRQAARRAILSEGHPRARPARADRDVSTSPSSTSAAFRSARGRPSRAWARGFGRAARSSAARGSRACATGSGARLSSSRRSRMFDQVQRGDPHWLSIQFMKSQKVDRVAAAQLLDSFEDAFMDWLEAFTMPTLVVCGDRGRRQRLGGGACQRPSQRGVRGSPRDPHELGHQAGVRRGDRQFPRRMKKGRPAGAPLIARMLRWLDCVPAARARSLARAGLLAASALPRRCCAWSLAAAAAAGSSWSHRSSP